MAVGGCGGVCGAVCGGGGCARLRHGVEDALDRIVLDGEEEAARELLARAAGGEHRRRGVRVHAARHQVVRLEHARDVAAVDAQRDAHQHVLGPLDRRRAAGGRRAAAEEVRALERAQPEVVVLVVALVPQRRLELVGELLGERHELLAHARRRLARLRRRHAAQRAQGVDEAGRRVAVEPRRHHPRREPPEVGVHRRLVRRRLRHQLVDLALALAPRVQPGGHARRERRRVDAGVEAHRQRRVRRARVLERLAGRPAQLGDAGLDRRSEVRGRGRRRRRRRWAEHGAAIGQLRSGTDRRAAKIGARKGRK